MRFTRKSRARIREKGKRVAIVGGGPAGLYAAGGLASEGYEVQVIDMLPEPGGLIVSGIPDLRMDKSVVREAVDDLVKAGVGFRLGTKVGQDLSLKAVLDAYDATLIATGTWKSTRLDAEGAGLAGLHYALKYLVDYALAQHGHEVELPDLRGRSVLVVGGGLTAVDACYVAREAGAEIMWFYRRSREQAPAREAEREEFDKLTREVDFCELTQPTRFIGAQGRVEWVEAIKMRLGEPDSSGRPKPIPVEGSEFRRRVDYVLLALGELPTPPPGTEECGIELNRETTCRATPLMVAKTLAIPAPWVKQEYVAGLLTVPRATLVMPRGQPVQRGTVKVDSKFRTTREGVFAAGNVVDGPTQAGYASIEGMMAARFVAEYLETGDWESERLGEVLGWEELIVG